MTIEKFKIDSFILFLLFNLFNNKNTLMRLNILPF